ncbi:MAG TPA: hypothetical protein VK474_08760 [Chthoniobacterales bacterium]|nr:hypothetical protein [Chthoniobacterales bacterium]
MRMLLFAALLFASTGYALFRGGTAERLGATTMFVGCFLTLAVNSPLSVRYASVEIPIMIIDIVMLLIFGALVLLTDRYWPLWVTALQLLVVLAHVAKLTYPQMLQNGYGFVMAAWSYPQLLAIALGTRGYRSRLESAAAPAT